MIIFLLFQYTQVAHNWVLHQQDEVGYNYLGPEKMEYKVKRIQRPSGLMEYHTYYGVGEVEDGDMIFSVSHYINPTPEEYVGEALDAAVSSFVEKIEGTLDYRSNITKDARPAVLWRMSHKDGNTRTKGQVIYHNDHYIIIQATFPSEKSLNAKIDAFIESIRLTW